MLKLESNFGDIDVKYWKFPAGETAVKLPSMGDFDYFNITLDFESNDDIINLMFLCDALREMKGNNISIDLYISYMPYARQDRYCDVGESFSLKVICGIIDSLDFKQIYVQDVHSEVMKAFFRSGTLVVYEQHILQYRLVESIINTYCANQKIAIVAPDAGAIKKATKAAKLHNLDMIEFYKKRSPVDGKIESVKCSIDKEELNKYGCLIVVDDICDNGGTFIALGNVIKNEYNFNGHLHLVVTHGNFGNGFDDLNKFYKTIEWVNPLVCRRKNGK